MNPEVHTEAASHNPEFERRKEKVTAFLNANKVYFLLAFIILVGIYIRAQPLDHLIDPTSGKYISIELDSTLFYRYAQYIAEHGSLFDVDPLRNYPLGAEINIGVFTSYFVAYVYKFLHIFNPNITVEYVDVIYPLIATAVLTLFLFLLIRRLFNTKVALLAAAFLTVLPSFLFRSLGGSSDHDILVMMLLFMVFYFYVAGWQTKNKRNLIICGILAGFLTIIGLETAGSIAFAFVTISVFTLVELFLNKFEDNDYYLLALYTGAVTLFWLIIIQRPISILFTSFSTSILYFAFLAATFYHFVPKLHTYLAKIPHLRKLPRGIQAFLLSFVFLLAFGTLFFGFSFIQDKFLQLADEVFKTSTRFSTNRWIITVAENKRPYVTDWFGQYGSLFVYSFIFGSIVLFYDMIKSFAKAKHLTALYAVFIFGYIFSRYSPNSALNGDSALAHQVFYGSILLFFGGIAFLYFYTYYKKPDLYAQIKTIDRKYTFIFIWFLIMVLAATSAIRLLFEFSTITAILAAIFFVTLYDYALRIKERNIRWAALGVLFLILFSGVWALLPFGIPSGPQGLVVNQYESSLAQARGSGPGYNQQWQLAGRWARENTPANAVFAHWWDYGYWVQGGFQRPTITDGGNFLAWWNYLMGRHVLTAANDTEPLKFLKAHDASYLLMVQDEIGKYGAYSSIGSDINYDRFSYIPTFHMNPQATEERRNQTIFTFQGGFGLDEDLIIDGAVYPKNAAGVGAVFVPIESVTVQEGDQTIQGARIHQPTAALVHNNQRIDLPFQCVYFNNQLHEFPDYKIPGCLRIIPTIENNQLNPFGAGLYLSRRTYTSLFAQLYLLNKQSEHFTLSYDDSANVPLALYNGMLIGPIRIWKVTYPNNLQLSPEDLDYNLRTSYIDPRLTQF